MVFGNGNSFPGNRFPFPNIIPSAPCPDTLSGRPTLLGVASTSLAGAGRGGREINVTARHTAIAVTLDSTYSSADYTSMQRQPGGRPGGRMGGEGGRGAGLRGRRRPLPLLSRPRCTAPRLQPLNSQATANALQPPAHPTQPPIPTAKGQGGGFYN